jgi:hypothetical protein
MSGMNSHYRRVDYSGFGLGVGSLDQIHRTTFHPRLQMPVQPHRGCHLIAADVGVPAPTGLYLTGSAA